MANLNNIIAPTQSVTLNFGGTITGIKTYESIKENTAVSSKDASGTREVKEGTAYITFVIDGVSYEGVLCVQKDESDEKQRNRFSLLWEAIMNVFGE